MEALRTTMKVNLSLGIVVLSLIAELLFIVLLGYGAYRIVDLLR